MRVIDKSYKLQEKLHNARQSKKRFAEGLRNVPIKDLEEKARVTYNPIFAKAVSDSVESEERTENAMKDVNKVVDEIVKEQENRETKIPKMPSLKKLHLEESLFTESFRDSLVGYQKVERFGHGIDDAYSGWKNDTEGMDILYNNHIIDYDDFAEMCVEKPENTCGAEAQSILDDLIYFGSAKEMPEQMQYEMKNIERNYRL